MHPHIFCLSSLAIKSGDFPEFKALIAQIVPATKLESGTIVYEYSVNDDQTVSHILSAITLNPWSAT